MAFTAMDLAQLESLVAASDGGLQVAAEFRSRFPGKSLTRCDASDMGAEPPYKQFDNVALYFVDGREHCWHLTTDPGQATGVVLAKRKGAP